MKSSPDKPHEAWIIEELEVDRYEQAVDLIIEHFEGADVIESFENGYWIFKFSSYVGQGKTRDAAWADLYHDEYWYDYGWTV